MEVAVHRAAGTEHKQARSTGSAGAAQEQRRSSTVPVTKAAHCTPRNSTSMRRRRKESPSSLSAEDLSPIAAVTDCNYAAELADALFPESRIITHNQDLLAKIQEYAISQSGEQRDTATARFVERIIYFNAPQGGAYLHHDLERGHAGVVYVQVSGETCWLALPKNTLLTNIQKFIQQCDHSGGWPVSFSHNFNKKERDQLTALSIDLSALDAAIESFNHSALIRLINETPEFVQALIANGHGHILKSGDAILLPQQTSPATEVQNCCWHSVFCIGDVAGEGLSFAIRTD